MENQFDDSMFFFDAAQDSLDLAAMLELYPIITTSTLPAKRNVSLDDPDSMLGHESDGTIFHDARSYRNLVLEQSQRRLSISISEGNQLEQKSAVSKSHTRPSILSRISGQLFTSTRHMQLLQEPRIRIHERGFPGSLSPDELEACLQLARELKRRPDLSDIVYSLSEIEDTPYALCRFLRSTKFDLALLLQRLESLAPDFQYAHANNFFPNLSEVMNGAPLYAFLKFYPFLSCGHAKNGCPVNYFQVGKIQAQMLFSIVDFASFEAFMWNHSFHAFQKHVKEQHNENIVRMETITVLDLSGLTYAAASSQEAMDAVKLATKIGNYFPESLHCMVILNAPTFFSAMWGIIKKMIDARTAKRIQVFSSFNKGKHRLLELIESTQIPEDYGGKGPTLAHVAEELSHQSEKDSTTCAKKRIIVEPIQLKRKGHREYCVHLESGEVGQLKIYTRSATSAKVSLHQMDSSTRHTSSTNVLVEEIVQGRRPLEVTTNDANTEHASNIIFHPVGTTIGSTLVGPAALVIKLQDLGEPAPTGVPHGQFVIIVEVS